MTNRRFYAPPTAIDQTQHTIHLDQTEARHLANVLRLRSGDEAFVFDGAGHEFRCRVTESTAKSGVLSIVEAVEPGRPESALRLTLAVALLKGEKFDLVVQKATELGVQRVIPVLTDRADVRLSDPAAGRKRVERWNRLAMEAAKQSGRALVPICEEPRPFSAAIADTAIADFSRVMFTERDGTSFNEIAAASEMISLIGPEGGWADSELDHARANGWTLVTLGGRVLRAETAAIAITALLQHRFGDLA